MIIKILKQIWTFKVFRICLFLLALFLFYRTQNPLITNTISGSVDSIWGVVVIPLLFLAIFRIPKSWHYYLSLVLLLVISPFLLFASQSYVIIILCLVLFYIYYIVSKTLFQNHYFRVLFILSNVCVFSFVLIMHLGYNPIALRHYKVIDYYPWQMVFVEKDSLYGVVDAYNGKEVIPVVFDSIAKVKNTNTEFISKLSPEQVDPLNHSQRVNSDGCFSYNNKDSLLKVVYSFQYESLLRFNRNGELDAKQNVLRDIDALYKSKDSIYLTTSGKFILEYRNYLLERIFRSKPKSSEIVDKYRDTIYNLAVAIIKHISNKYTNGGLYPSDISELRLLLSRCIHSSIFKCVNEQDNSYMASVLIQQMLKTLIPSDIEYTTNDSSYIVLHIDDNKPDTILKRQVSFSYTINNIFKRDLAATRNLYLNSISFDILQVNDSSLVYSQTSSNHTQKLNDLLTMLVEHNNKSDNYYKMVLDSLSGMVNNVDFKNKPSEHINKWIKYGDNVKKSLTASANDISVFVHDDNGLNIVYDYNYPTDGLDSLIYINVPMILDSIHNNDNYIDLHSSVEEIYKYLLISAFCRSYNIDNYLTFYSRINSKHKYADNLGKIFDAAEKYNNKMKPIIHSIDSMLGTWMISN